MMKDLLFKEIEALPRNEELNANERQVLKEVLNNKTFRRALGIVHNLADDELSNVMKHQDLGTDEGSRAAAKAQGELQGAVRVIEDLCDLAHDEEDEEDG